MDNEKEVFEAEVEEKETVDAEVVEEEIQNTNPGFDPNVVLNTIMQNQDAELRSVALKLSTLNSTTKITLICVVLCLLFKFAVYMAAIFAIYSLYCGIYVLLHYKKVKENEFLIKDVMSKNNESINIKKVVIKNVLIIIGCLALIAVAFWYWHIFVVA